MLIELHCPRCSCCLRAAPETPAAEILDRMTEEGPWFALDDGETFEDMVFAALLRRGRILCPECRTILSVGETSFEHSSRRLSPCC